MKQGVFEQVAVARYPIGKRIAIGDWVFRYSRALTALTLNKRGAGNGDVLHEQNTAVVAVAGATSITIVGNFTEDQFKDGYINVWTDPVQINLRVKGNDAGDGVNTVIHLKDPLLADVALATFTDIHANIYNNVSDLAGSGLAGEMQIVCVPLIAITIGYHFWGLTWGPTVGIAYKGAGLGAAVNEKTAYFWPDGSIGALADVTTDGGTAGQQIAGTMLARLANPAGTPADDIFYMLKLAP